MVEWAGLVAIGAILVTIWGYLKWAFNYVGSFFVMTFECHGACQYAVMAYARANMKPSPFRYRIFDGFVAHIRPRMAYGFVANETVGVAGGLFWYKNWYPVWISRTSSVAAQDDHTTNHTKPLKVTTCRLFMTQEDFITEALAFAEALVRNRPRRFSVVHHTGSGKRVMSEPRVRPSSTSNHWESVEDAEKSYIGWNREDIGPPIEPDGVGALALGPEAEAFCEEARNWAGLKSWFTERAIPWKLGALFYGKPGCGKCLGKGTPVLMYDGTIKPVEDIAVGEKLMGPDSKPRTVLSLARGSEMLYRVTPVKGDSYVVNESHILSLKMSGHPGYGHGEVVNLGVKDYLASGRAFQDRAKGWRTGVEFQAKPVPLDPYFLGAWLGDGTSGKPEITTADDEIIQECQWVADKHGLSAKLHYGSSGEAATCSIRNRRGSKQSGKWHKNPIIDGLRSAGVWKNKHIPLDYLANSRDVRLQVLAGLIDTDGHLTCNAYDIVQKSEVLANGIAFLARSLGLAAYITKCRKQCVNNGARGDYYRISISGDVSCIPVRIARKRATARLQKKSVLVTGIDVTPIGVGEYFGFEIDGDHLFMLGDFTVTHNTALVRALGQELDMPVHVFDLSSMQNFELRQEWDAVTADLPAIVLLEDIDGVFDGREPRPGVEVTFDCLLNCIDGVERTSGLLTIVTTNKPETLDEALRNRPGRIDSQIEFDHPTEEGRRHIASRILRDWPDLIEQAVSDGDGESGAHFERRCVRIAMSQPRPKPPASMDPGLERCGMTISVQHLRDLISGI